LRCYLDIGYAQEARDLIEQRFSEDRTACFNLAKVLIEFIAAFVLKEDDATEAAVDEAMDKGLLPLPPPLSLTPRQPWKPTPTCSGLSPTTPPLLRLQITSRRWLPLSHPSLLVALWKLFNTSTVSLCLISLACSSLDCPALSLLPLLQRTSLSG
jgi:hypothetical protein